MFKQIAQCFSLKTNLLQRLKEKMKLKLLKIKLLAPEEGLFSNSSINGFHSDVINSEKSK